MTQADFHEYGLEFNNALKIGLIFKRREDARRVTNEVEAALKDVAKHALFRTCFLHNARAVAAALWNQDNEVDFTIYQYRLEIDTTAIDTLRNFGITENFILLLRPEDTITPAEFSYLQNHCRKFGIWLHDDTDPKSTMESLKNAISRVGSNKTKTKKKEVKDGN